jgi:two-component system cell cycle response regulator
MTRRPNESIINEMVPLANRLLYMQVVRLLASLGVLGYVAAATARITIAPRLVVVGTLSYVALAGVAHLFWHVLGRRNITLFGALLIVDGFYLCWVASVSGGSVSPLRWIAVLHVMMTALLASYRTAVKLAVWHTLLALVTLQIVDGGYGDAAFGVKHAPAFEQVATVCFVIAVWLSAVGTASFAAMNERELRRRKIDLEDLARMATGLEQVSTPEDVGSTLRRALVEAYGFSRLEILAVNADGLYPLEAGAPAVPTAGVDEVIHRAIEAHRSVLVAWAEPRRNPYLAERMPNAKNLVVTPLFAEGNAIGAVVAEHGSKPTPRIERRVVSMLERFCAHAALALRNAWLLEEVRKVAATDGLTGLANRRTFEETLTREVARSARTATPLGLVMLDIDHFKKLNDTYGHRAGDLALQNVAAVLRDCAREMDVVARYGGEELAVIIPGAGEREAAAVGERLREAVEALAVEPRVTASVGVASYPVAADSAEGLVRAADAAMYDAKRAGRNRMCVATACGVNARAVR